MKEKDETLVNSRQLAGQISISMRSLERHRANGIIPFIPLTKRTYLYDPKKVIEALKRLEVPSRLLKKDSLN